MKDEAERRVISAAKERINPGLDCFGELLRGKRLAGVTIGAPQRAELRRQRVSVDIPPRKRQAHDVVKHASTASSWRDPSHALVAKRGEVRLLYQTARGTKPLDLGAARAQSRQGATQDILPCFTLEPVPGLVTPGMTAKLVAAFEDCRYRVGIPANVDCLNEECRVEPGAVKEREDPGQCLDNGEVRRGLDLSPELFVRRLPEVVERQDDVRRTPTI